MIEKFRKTKKEKKRKEKKKRHGKRLQSECEYIS